MSRQRVIEQLEKECLKQDIPEFSIGDTLKLSIKITEEGESNKERVQAFTGTVIARKGTGISESISLYRVAYGSAMERVFMLHSPRIIKIEKTRSGKVRRSKLYYLRGVMGKKAKVDEKITSREKAVEASDESTGETNQVE
ncbi:MAG: 50S ribosomal protein L19 [Chlamydiales bacterium]|nr:50S ribosomal protein L19 [Chlamydiales bacterium]